MYFSIWKKKNMLCFMLLFQIIFCSNWEKNNKLNGEKMNTHNLRDPSSFHSCFSASVISQFDVDIDEQKALRNDIDRVNNKRFLNAGNDIDKISNGDEIIKNDDVMIYMQTLDENVNKIKKEMEEKIMDLESQLTKEKKLLNDKDEEIENLKNEINEKKTQINDQKDNNSNLRNNEEQQHHHHHEEKPDNRHLQQIWKLDTRSIDKTVWSSLPQKNTDTQELFELMCTKMTQYFTEEGVEKEGKERIQYVVNIFHTNFNEYIKNDRWGLRKNQILEDKILDHLQELCAKTLNEDEKKELEEYKVGVLRNILDYYGTLATKKHKVDAIVQAFVGIVHTKTDGIWESHCDLPHRRFNVETWYVSPNCRAVSLGLVALFFQMVVPPAMMFYTLTRDPNNYSPLDLGEVSANTCPFALDAFGEKTWSEINHAILLKMTSGGLLWHLYGCLKKEADEEWEIFRINWQSLALPRVGLIWSRIQNTIVFYLVICTTIILFFGNRNFADVLLNYLAMEFVMKIDDELADKHEVPKGIGTENDGGRKIVLCYVASGIRDTTKMEKFFDSPLWSTGTKLGFVIFLVILFWGVYCG